MARAKPRTAAQAHWTEDEWLEHQVAQLTAMVQAAVNAGSFAPAAALNKQLREVRKEIDLRRAATSTEELPEDTGQHLEEMIREIRSMKASAQVAGSWVAASALAKRELEVVKEFGEYRASLEPEAVAVTLPELIEILQERLAALPPVIQARLRKQIAGT